MYIVHVHAVLDLNFCAFDYASHEILTVSKGSKAAQHCAWLHLMWFQVWPLNIIVSAVSAMCIATLFPCRHWGHAVRTSQLKTTPSTSTTHGNSLRLSCPHLAMLSLRGSVTVAFNQPPSTHSLSPLAATSVVNSQTQSLSVSQHLYTHRVLYWPGQASTKYMYTFLVIFFCESTYTPSHVHVTHVRVLHCIYHMHEWFYSCGIHDTL